MAHHALHAGFKVLAMAPVHARRKLVYPYPGDWLAGLRKLGELLDRGLTLCDGSVALHAQRSCGERHHLTGIGIGVAALAR